MFTLGAVFLVAATSSGMLAADAAGVSLEITPPSQLVSPLIASKLANTAGALSSNGPPMYPQWTYLSGNGTWQYFPAATWTSGFLPASLYLMNTRKSVLCKGDNGAGSTDWLATAQNWMQGLDPVANPNAGLFDGVRHDVGFLSFGWIEALALNGNDGKAKAAINSYATYLASRFNPNVGCTMSWNPRSSDPTEFRVIIDNMMNLELLIVSSKLTGNSTLYNIATSHANKTMVNHLRPDASTYHVVNYNQTTGAVVWQQTAQGYADNSTWTRGQAWGIHGFATMYNYTGDLNYWVTSRRLAEYYLSRLPESGVPPWDFDAPAVPGRPSDTSSATIAASGMLMLSRFEQSSSNMTGANYWANAAVRLLNSTTNLAWREESNWQSLLSNGTVNNPANPPNNNTGIIYGDYYYIKAGNELLDQGLMNCSNGQAAAAARPTSPSSPQANSGTALPSVFWALVGLGDRLSELLKSYSHKRRPQISSGARTFVEQVVVATPRLHQRAANLMINPPQLSAEADKSSPADYCVYSKRGHIHIIGQCSVRTTYVHGISWNRVEVFITVSAKNVIWGSTIASVYSLPSAAPHDSRRPTQENFILDWSIVDRALETRAESPAESPRYARPLRDSPNRSCSLASQTHVQLMDGSTSLSRTNTTQVHSLILGRQQGRNML